MPGKRRPAAERFADYVALTDSDCLQWVGSVNGYGYGTFHAGGGRHSVVAHRWSYEYHRGPIPHGLVLDHLCRNTSCVNPAHLEAVTQSENLLRAVGIGQTNTTKTHCPQGHPYSGDNLYEPPGRPNRMCRTCRRNAKRKEQAA